MRARALPAMPGPAYARSSTAFWPTVLCVATIFAADVEQHGERQVVDKTPTPCKGKYDDSFIAKAAEDHLKSFGCAKDKPRMLLLLGGSGAGKGTFLRHIQKSGFNLAAFVPHGLDEYLVQLPEYMATTADTEHVFKDAADACYGGGAIPIAQTAQKLLIERRCDLYYEETGKNLDRILKRVLPPFADAGYSISIVLIDSLPSIAIERAAGRFQKEGRYAPDDYIEGSFKNVFENYQSLRKNKLVQEATYCDNSCLNVRSGPSGPGDCMRCWEHTEGAVLANLVVPAAALLHGPVQYLPREASHENEL